MSLAIASTALQQLLDDGVAKHRVPGASLAVLQDDELSTVASGVLKSRHRCRIDRPIRCSRSDRSRRSGRRPSSCSSSTRALVELDAPLRRYIPDFTVGDESVAEAVTIRHLLTHSSGIDGDNFTDTGRRRCAREVRRDVRVASTGASAGGDDVVLQHRFHALLGRVIEVATGEVWDTALRTRLIEPMKLTHTARFPEDVLRYRAAIGHIEPPGHERTTAPMWGLPRTAGPPGGVCSTSTEVVRFAQLHLAGGTLGDMQILSPGGRAGDAGAADRRSERW